MASRFYAVDVGSGNYFPSAVVEGAATASKGVEVQVDLTKATDRTQILLALEAIKAYIEQRETTPVA